MPTSPLAGRRRHARVPRVCACACSSWPGQAGRPPGRVLVRLIFFFSPLWLYAVLGRSVPCVFFFLVRAPVVSRFLWFPAPGALGLDLVLCVFFLGPLGSPPAILLFFPPVLPLAAPWCLPPPPFYSVWLVSSLLLGVPPPLFFLYAPPLSLAFSGFRPRVPTALALCFVCFVGLLLLGSLCALSFFCVSPGRWLLPGGCCPPPPPPAAWCSVLFFFALCAPVLSGFLWFPAPGALRLGAAHCLLCWPPASRLSVRCRLFRAPRLAFGCSPVVSAPPPHPLLCLAVFVASARCCVPCVVLCSVCRVAVLRCAARCVARCGAVVCCVVLLRSVGAPARRAVPSGAPHRPGALCFAALCFAVFPRAVCVLSLRGGVCCCSPLCFVLYVSLGAVLCVTCPLRSVRCCALLCWCACVVLFVWCVLLLAPGAVVRCRVLCCFLWCAVVRCLVSWPVVVCWCRAVAPCCPFSFAGGVGLCLFPVCAVLCCAACRVVRFWLRLGCCWCLVLWRVPVCCGVSLGVLRCGGAALLCRGVLLCCALSCGVLRPVLCPAVLCCYAVLCWWAVLRGCLRCWCLFFLLSAFPLLNTPAVFLCL